ncbi:MAG: 50S ribosomal protein L15 [Clostridia bacterium]
MPKIHELRPNPGSKTGRRRVGRGRGSGMGKNCGRGTNGQNSRSGGGVRPGFEGGQMPLQRRLPKIGFSNARFRARFATVNIRDLNQFEEGAEVTPETLIREGLIKKMEDGVKVLGDGELEVGLTVRAHQFSTSAEEKITAAGGKAEVI